jgi:hypothetical protein
MCESAFTDSGMDFKLWKQTLHYTTGVSFNAEKGIRPLDSMREFCKCGSNRRPSHPNLLFFSMVQELENAPSYLLAPRFWTQYPWVMKTYPLLQGEKRDKIQSEVPAAVTKLFSYEV